MADTVQIQFDYKAWDSLLSKVKSKWRDVKTRKEFGGVISATVFQDIMEHFDEEKGPDGAWTNWSRSYMQAIAGLVAFRRINGRTVPITDDKFLAKNKPPRKPGKKLQATGRLRQSFKPQSWRATGQGILFFNNAKTKSGFPYAAHHDDGPSGWDGKPRKFMWMSDKGMNNMAERVAAWLLEVK
jgi:phage gpG-like protein